MCTPTSSSDLISLCHAASLYFEPLPTKVVGYSACATGNPYELTLLWVLLEEPERKKICFRSKLGESCKDFSSVHHPARCLHTPLLALRFARDKPRLRG